MEKTLKDALEHRRSYYNITNSSPISDVEIEDILNFAITNTPSAFNSQSTRIVLLLGQNHKKFWDITKESLRKVVPESVFATTEIRINAFAVGYGTILYYEDQNVIKSLQSNFNLYASNFPTWSEQTSAMHQLTIWTMLEEKGLGASLQHYNSLINEEVSKEWSLPDSWKLIAQMPFGAPTAEPDKKSIQPISERLFIFKD